MYKLNIVSILPKVAKSLSTGLIEVVSSQLYSAWIFSPLCVLEFIKHLITVIGVDSTHPGVTFPVAVDWAVIFIVAVDGVAEVLLHVKDPLPVRVPELYVFPPHRTSIIILPLSRL